ncbi:MAG: hypothetical protein EI684_07970 [Candidatus Viridilinea halotolerans]|uniref:Uncharacterized protein n=1 Tax=Candidatus Viridilinea halotolerans TaxID=2491704 RepID=A0A426U2Q2_9CHLR|nr:MAG: hypothetical protein EI684_07970 [Candidatus Viridilinea halotolerans]
MSTDQTRTLPSSLPLLASWPSRLIRELQQVLKEQLYAFVRDFNIDLLIAEGEKIYTLDDVYRDTDLVTVSVQGGGARSATIMTTICSYVSPRRGRRPRRPRRKAVTVSHMPDLRVLRVLRSLRGNIKEPLP